MLRMMPACRRTPWGYEDFALAFALAVALDLAPLAVGCVGWSSIASKVVTSRRMPTPVAPLGI